jgi:hypothetical protein
MFHKSIFILLALLSACAPTKAPEVFRLPGECQMMSSVIKDGKDMFISDDVLVNIWKIDSCSLGFCMGEDTVEMHEMHYRNRASSIISSDSVYCNCGPYDSVWVCAAYRPFVALQLCQRKGSMQRYYILHRD